MVVANSQHCQHRGNGDLAQISTSRRSSLDHQLDKSGARIQSSEQKALKAGGGTEDSYGLRANNSSINTLRKVAGE